MWVAVAVVLIALLSFSWDRALGLVWLLHFKQISTLFTFLSELFAMLYQLI